MLKGNNNIKFMCVTMVDPTMDMLEIEETPTVVSMDKRDTTNKIFNKTSAETCRLVYKAQLSHYPQLRFIIYDNGSKFKLHFILCNQFGIEYKPTTINNHTRLEFLHEVLSNMIHLARLQCTNDHSIMDVE